MRKTIALALFMAFMLIILSACNNGNNNNSDGNQTTPPPSSTPGSSQSASTETPSQSPMESTNPTPTGGEGNTTATPDTSGDSNKQDTQEFPGEGMTLQEYIDSITAEFKLSGAARNSMEQGLRGTLEGIDTICARYNCPVEDIEDHKKWAVEHYFDGIAELLESGHTLDSDREWSGRRVETKKASDDWHIGN